MLFLCIVCFRNSSLKKRSEPDVFKIPTRKKFNSYIHHVVSHSLPPTAQVGGAVIKSPRLPLPPIQLPNTAPPIITIPPKKTVSYLHKEAIDAGKNPMDIVPQRHTHKDPSDKDKTELGSMLRHTYKEQIDTEIDAPTLQSNSDISVGSNEVKETDDHNINSTDITPGATLPTSAENLLPSMSPLKTAKNVPISPPEVDSYKQKIKPLRNPDTTKSLKRPLKHKKKLASNTLSSPPLSSSDNLVATDSLHSDKDDKLLMTLKGKTAKLSSNFDVVTSLTGQKR